MLVKRTLVVLKLLVFSFLIDVESQDIKEQHSPTGDDNFPDEYNYPLVMIHDNDPEANLPLLPTTVEIAGDKPILKHGSNSDVRYLCPTEDAELLALIGENPGRKSFDELNCLSEAPYINKSSDKKCRKKVHPHLAIYENSYSVSSDGHSVPFEQARGQGCGKKHSGKLYGFSYWICAPGNATFLRTATYSKIAKKDVNIYDFCYDNGKIIYTHHKILSPSILKNIKYIDELSGFHWNQISTNSYEEFGDVFVNKRKQVEKDKLEPHKSVPPENMAFGTWKKALYHYSNIMGMPSIVSSLWKFIDERIRYAAKQSDSELELYMGEFNSEEGIFWCKLVFDEKNSKGVAIVIMKKSPTEIKEPSKYARQASLSDPKLNEILRTCTERVNMQNWVGYSSVEGKLDLVRFCKILDIHLDLFGLKVVVQKLTTHAPVYRRNKPKFETLYANENHPKIAQNYFNLDDLPS